MSSGIPKINELPLSQDFIPGDKIIIDRGNKGYLLDFDNIYVQFSDISFQQDIINDSNKVNNLKVYSEAKYNELVNELTEKSISRSTAHLIDITNTSSQGALSSSNYREFIISSETPFSGPNNLVIFDDALVDKLSINIDGVTDTDNLECDVDRVVYGSGTISVPPGTYRIRASISLSPEVNLNLDQDTLDEYIRKKQQVWAYMSFVQLTTPERTILNGSGACTYNNIGQSVTLNLNGYFYTDKTRQYGIKIHTLGKLFPGVVTGTYPQDTNSNLLDSKYLSISDLFGREQYNQSRILIERISDTNTLNPLEDSPAGFRSQALVAQLRAPLLYNAGWLQRINAQNNSVIPSTLQTTISALPFQFRPEVSDYVGDLKGYITEPKAYQGYVKIGDTVRFRVQQLDSKGILPTYFNQYNAKDTSLRILSPGWYGLIVNTSKTVGQRYDTIFRVDLNGVVSQREYITDPSTYVLDCKSAPPPPSTTATPITTTLAPTLVPGELIATSGDIVTYIVPENGPQFIHAVCVGGGEAGKNSNTSRAIYETVNKRIVSYKIEIIGEPARGGRGGDLTYCNNIPVFPGDVLILKSGAAGTGSTSFGGNSFWGNNSELFIRRNGSSTDTLILRAAGGGQSPPVLANPNIRIGRGGLGGIGCDTKGLRLAPFVVAFPSINPGGGGAGGYNNFGGVGGSLNTFAMVGFKPVQGQTILLLPAGNGGNGNSGGGGGGTTGYGTGSGGAGGGVGIFGQGTDGAGGRILKFAGASVPGGPGSDGTGQTYGGGGLGIVGKGISFLPGGPGAVRVIWGDGRSFPNNAR